MECWIDGCKGRERVKWMAKAFCYYLDFASVEFSEDTRQQVRSCSTLPQALDNAVDLVKSTLPKGKQS